MDFILMLRRTSGRRDIAWSLQSRYLSITSKLHSSPIFPLGHRRFDTFLLKIVPFNASINGSVHFFLHLIFYRFLFVSLCTCRPLVPAMRASRTISDLAPVALMFSLQRLRGQGGGALLHVLEFG